MNSCGCRRGRLSIGRARPSAGGRNDLVLGGAIGDAGEGHSAGMALERRVELHAGLFAAGGGDLCVLLRSAGGGIAAYRRWFGVGGVFVRGGGSAESDVGARVEKSGSGCVSSLTGPVECSVP